MSDPLQLDDNTLHIKNWENKVPGLVAGFTSRRHGVSDTPYDSWNMGLHVGDKTADVLRNRQILAEKVSIPLDSFVVGEQIHGTQVKKIGQYEKGCGSKQLDTSLKGIDGIYTKEKGILCAAFFADCVPLFFLDPVSGWIGIAHAGWKGTVGRIAEKMVWKLTDAGANPSDLLAVIGPCISKENYEVDDQVIKHLTDREQEIAASDLANGRYLLDLKKLNENILYDAGLPEENVAITNYCTFDDERLFFSHRRDRGKTGRMLAFIGYRHYI